MSAVSYYERKAVINQLTNSRESQSTEWLLCPVCNSKTRIKLRPDTEFKRYREKSKSVQKIKRYRGKIKKCKEKSNCIKESVYIEMQIAYLIQSE